MKKLIKLPFVIIGFVLLIPIDLICIFFDHDPIGMDLIEWGHK